MKNYPNCMLSLPVRCWKQCSTGISRYRLDGWSILLCIHILFVYTEFQPVKAQENKRFFTFTPISEVEFRAALKNNYNAPIVTEIDDSTKLEKAFDAIAKTYTKEEKELTGKCLKEVKGKTTKYYRGRKRERDS